MINELPLDEKEIDGILESEWGKEVLKDITDKDQAKMYLKSKDLPSVKEITKLWRIHQEEIKKKDNEIKKLEKKLIKKKEKYKVPAHYLNNLFTTINTLKSYQKEIEDPNFLIGEGKKRSDTEVVKQTYMRLEKWIDEDSFKGIDLNYWESRTIKGVLSLLDKQKATRERPSIVIKNKSELYEEILERKGAVKIKGKEYTKFNTWETKEVDKALESLENEKKCDIAIKAWTGKDKDGKDFYMFYLRENEPLIKTTYIEGTTKSLSKMGIKEIGIQSIAINPMLLLDKDKYFRMLPKFLSREIREACPEIKRITKPMQDFIDYLHRQDYSEFSRTREEIILILRLNDTLKEHGKKYVSNIIINCYEVAKRTGYLLDYELDQQGTFEIVDRFILNKDKFYHFQPKTSYRKVIDVKKME